MVAQMNLETLITVYEEFLKSLNVKKDDNNRLSLVIGDQTKLISIADKQLVLPSQQLLKDGIGNNVVFHPLSENIQYGESQVLKKIKTLITIRLSCSIYPLMNILIDIISNQSIHSKLTPKASVILSKVKDVDEKATSNLKKIVERLTESDSAQFFSIYLKRNGKLNAKTYSRVSIISFPISSEFEFKKDPKILGLSVRKKDIQIFEDFIEYLFPNFKSNEAYSAGSSCNVAPYFDSLVHSFYNVSKQINSVLELFKNVIEKNIFEEIFIPNDWIDKFDNLSCYDHLIPPLPFNEGERLNLKQDPNAKNHPLTVPTGLINKLTEPVQESKIETRIRENNDTVNRSNQNPSNELNNKINQTQKVTEERRISFNDAFNTNRQIPYQQAPLPQISYNDPPERLNRGFNNNGYGNIGQSNYPSWVNGGNNNLNIGMPWHNNNLNQTRIGLSNQFFNNSSEGI